MDRQVLVGVVDRLTDVEEQPEPPADRQPPGVAVGVDGLAVHVLHREVREPLRRHAGVEDLGNVGVIQAREQPGLAREPAEVGVGGPVAAADHLQRDRPPQRLVLGAVDDAHAALADPVRHRVRADLTADAVAAGTPLGPQGLGGDGVGQHGLDERSEVGAVGAGRVEEGRPLAGWQRARLLVELEQETVVGEGRHKKVAAGEQVGGPLPHSLVTGPLTPTADARQDYAPASSVLTPIPPTCMRFATRRPLAFRFDLAPLVIAAAVVLGASSVSAQVRLVGDLAPGPGNGLSGESPGFTALGDRVYFHTSANNGAGTGAEIRLWTYDPVSEEAGVVATVSETASGAPLSRFEAVEFVALDDRLYFFTQSPSTVALWEYDPATGQAQNVAEYDAQPQDVTVESVRAVSGTLYILTTDWYEDDEPRLLAFDPTTRTTATLSGGLYVGGIAALGGLLYLSAEPTPDSSYPDVGIQLWALAPGTDELTLVELVPGGTYGVSTEAPVVVGDRLVVSGCTGASAADCGYVRYDPSTETAALIISSDDLTAALGEYTYIDGVGFGDSRIYFVWENFAGDAKILIAIDVATGELTRLTSDTLDEVAIGNTDRRLHEVGGRLVFAGSTEGTGEELWALDPASGATTLLADLVAGPDGSGPEDLTVVGDALYFVAYTAATGREPYVYAPAGTTAQESGRTARALALSAPAPNPAASQARLELALDRGQRVEAAAFDVLGRRVAVLHDGEAPAGRLPLVLDVSSLPAGVYVVRVRGEAGTVSQMITVAR